MVFYKKNQHFLAVLCMITMCLFTVGCASTPASNTDIDMSSIRKQMILTAKSVAESKQIRARSENALRLATLSDEEQEKYRHFVNDIPEGLDYPVSYNERIEARLVLAMIAQLTRWDFEVRGRVPVNGAMVYVNHISTPAIDVITDVEAQIKDRAKVILVKYTPGSPKKGMMILEYKETNL